MSSYFKLDPVGGKNNVLTLYGLSKSGRKAVLIGSALIAIAAIGCLLAASCNSQVLNSMVHLTGGSFTKFLCIAGGIGFGSVAIVALARDRFDKKMWEVTDPNGEIRRERGQKERAAKNKEVPDALYILENGCQPAATSLTRGIPAGSYRVGRRTTTRRPESAATTPPLEIDAESSS